MFKKRMDLNTVPFLFVPGLLSPFSLIPLTMTSFPAAALLVMVSDDEDDVVPAPETAALLTEDGAQEMLTTGDLFELLDVLDEGVRWLRVAAAVVTAAAVVEEVVAAAAPAAVAVVTLPSLLVPDEPFV